MSGWRATTTVTVLRGESTDAYGDPIDIDATVYRGVPASIIEQQPNSRSRPVDGRTDQVRGYACRIGPRYELRKNDRLRDERTGAVYTVDIVQTPANPAGHTNRNLTLRKLS